MVFNIFRRKKEVPKEDMKEPEAPSLDMGTKPYDKKLPEELELKEENKKVIEVLKNIKDPELDLDLWSLGLIYDLNINEGIAKITMTFTSPMCPYGPRILWEVEDKIKDISLNPKINLVFNPPWEPSEELRDMIGI
jgi:metal-sulfur cluster biosynthetic enzyme